MTKIRRRGYVFVSWIGDHKPPHVHVFRDGTFVGKYDYHNHKAIQGKISKKIEMIIRELIKEGRL